MCEKSWACGLVIDGSMVFGFGHVVAIVFFARGPVVSELSAKKICHGANGISCPSILVF